MERKASQKRTIGGFRPLRSFLRIFYAGEAGDVKKYNLDVKKLPIKGTLPFSNNETAGLHRYVRKGVGPWGSEKITKDNY